MSPKVTRPWRLGQQFGVNFQAEKKKQKDPGPKMWNPMELGANFERVFKTEDTVVSIEFLRNFVRVFHRYPSLDIGRVRDPNSWPPSRKKKNAAELTM